MRPLRLTVLAALPLLVGCAASSGPGLSPGFTLIAAPSKVVLQSGGTSQALSVTVAGTASSTAPVSVALSGLPSGVTATPTSLSLTAGQVGQFRLTAGASAAPVSATSLTVIGAANGMTSTAAASLSVLPVPDFSLAAAPASVSLQSGGSARSLSVSVSPVDGFTAPVTVVLTGLPAGVTATPSTLTVTPGQIGQFQLSASSSAPVVSSASVTISGTADALSHTTTAALSVTASPLKDFSLTAAPSSLSLQSGGSARSLSVTVSAINGFTDPVSVSLTGLPSGVTASPSTVSITPGQIGQFQLKASSSAAVTSSASVTVAGTADSLTHSATAALAVTAAAPVLSNAALSASTFDFGDNLVGSTLTKSVVTITNTGTAAINLNPSVSGDPSFSIASSTCGTSLAAGASCSESVSYVPATASGSTPQTATLNLNLGNVPTGTAQTVTLTGTSAALPQGTVSTTNNPQVALYTMTLPFPGSVTINFGTDTTYGHQTWTQSTTQPGGIVSIYVAGMLPNTAYHMQATVQLQNGVTATDVDHTFNSGTPLMTPNLTVVTTAGLTPQSGVEELTPLLPSRGIVVTDLQGNVIWSYVLPNAASTDDIEGVKLLPNGDFLINISEGSVYSFLNSNSPANAIVAVREIDLAGNIVREITINDLNDELQAKYAATGESQYNLTLEQFHHDVTPLPNGHWFVLSNVTESRSDVVGYPNPTNVLGDVIVDLDQNLQPVWIWNEFDHFDVNRHPMQFPDWTHTNAVVYTPDDHNILVSMRHQNWVVKVDYEDGAGSGNVLWRLGQGGDFTLQGGTDPQDWQYAQHYPSIVGTKSAGVFSLTLMDNGDDRIYNDGDLCGSNPNEPCYSTIPIFQIDETAKTATLTYHQVLNYYNDWGGNAEVLSNGDIEFDLCDISGSSHIAEITPTSTLTPVWQMTVNGENAYRGFRIPSLYPGVQW